MPPSFPRGTFEEITAPRPLRMRRKKMLQDKVVVVAGTGPGLGRAIALRSAGQGADIVLAARTEQVLTDIAQEVTKLGRRALPVPTDVTDEASADALAKVALETFGHVD